MKNTSILIPIILIVCLSVFGFLVFKAMQTVEDGRSTGNQTIILDPADYTDEEVPTDIGTTTDYDTAPPIPTETTTTTNSDTPGTANEMREMSAVEKRAAEREEQLEDERRAREQQAAANATTNDNAATTTTSNNTARDTNRGRYLVIAGSFRQKTNAEERVEALISAGFKDTRLEKFNRGTFAVALAGQSDRYTEAKTMAAEIIAAGFEARVMRRR